MPSRPVVYLVDDDLSIRRTLPAAIASKEYRVEAFDSAQAFLAKYDGQSAGCVILDLKMPEMDGLALQNEMLSRQWKLPIVFLSGNGSIAAATQAMKAGAIYFIEKPIEPKVLITRIGEALEQDRKRRRQQAHQLEIDSRLARLTRRQREVLDLVVLGLSSRQIAEKLERSIKTVEVHRSQILSRMGARGVAELIHMVLSPD